VDNQLKEFLNYRPNANAASFNSLQLYRDTILYEKKNYLRASIKSRQLKRIVMMILNKSTIPSDIEEYKKMT